MFRFSLFVAVVFALFGFGIQTSFALERTVGPSGEAVPRFVSLKSDEVNVRRGPGRDHKILWVFKKLGLPVKIVSEYEQWREIEDQSGAKGWIFFGLLSKRRTAITVDPGKIGLTSISIYEDQDKDDEPIAQLGKGLILHILTCTGQWCHVAVNKELKGWVEQSLVWGLFAKEPLAGQ